MADGLLRLTDAEDGHFGKPLDVVAAHIVSFRPAEHGTDIILVGGAFIPVRENHTVVRRLWTTAMRNGKGKP